MNHVEVKGLPVDLGDRTIRFIASNEDEDRDGDILRASGCDFKNFAKNPQFLGFHNYHDFPLGVPKNWGVDPVNKRVYIDVRFPTVDELSTDPAQASEKAKLVDFTYNCYKTGMLKAVSVGFIAKDAEPNHDSDSRWGQIINKWELMELSAVPIPANAGALAESIKSYDPSGKLAEMFEINVEEKSGRRISAETRKTIDAIKACHEKIKACHKELDELMADLDDDDDEPEEPTLEIDD